MTSLVDIVGVQSLLVLVFTFGVGYLTLYWAYRRAKRLHVWHRLSDFDKAMRTFIIGGIVSGFTFLFSHAPVDSSEPSVWWYWFSQQGWFFFAIIFVLSVVYLEGFLQPKTEQPEKRHERTRSRKRH